MQARSVSWLRLVMLLLAFTLPVRAWAAPDFLAPASDERFIRDAIDKERPGFAVPDGVTGITVPHHLLAADLIARGFWAASGRQYKRLIVISPDHFKRVKGRFATSTASMPTPFGTLKADRTAVDALLARKDLFEEADLTREHGIQALMPFARHFFPDAQVVVVVASIFTGKADWQAAAEALSHFADADTLIVQSTDYSHYRPISETIQRDQESMTMIATADPEAVELMLQPYHMDSKAAQFIQMTLQRSVYNARPAIIANRNSAEYSGNPEAMTSYIVTVFHPDQAAMSVARYGDQSVFYFAGDTLFGRYMRPILRDEKAGKLIVDTVERLTAGAPLIVNLEGVLVDETVAASPTISHLMNTDIARRFLSGMNVVGASLANNHSYDFGDQGFEESRRALTGLGIRPLIHREVTDFGAFRLLPLILFSGRHISPEERSEILDTACRVKAAPPLIVFIHWGEEYTSTSGPREDEAARHLASCGVTATIGAHSHRASEVISNVAGHMQSVFSLGNFLFDQNASRSSGALAELRIFDHGTVAMRLLPLPNFFDVGNADIGGRE